MEITQAVSLNNGVQMPRVGFGVWRIDEGDAEPIVSAALQAGYRSIDTAALYRNESAVGRAVRGSGLARQDVFVTTKLDNDAHGRDAALRAFDQSLLTLDIDYIDLYLIHWPIPKKDLYVETWQALVEILQQGAARAIGVSNFLPHHLQRIVAASGVVPALNQIECNPYITQERTRAYDTQQGIVTEAWAPLAVGDVLADPVITAIAERYERTAAQVILRWHLQHGNVIIPKTVRSERMAENLQLFEFSLDDAAMSAIDRLNRDRGSGLDPDLYNPGVE